MAATAEFVPEIFEGERYGESLHAEHQWYGFIALQAAGIEIEQVRLEAVVENAFDDHMTALTENMVTDEEYAEELVFGTPKIRRIVDGRVVSRTGRPIADVVETGAKYSRKLAEDDSEFQHQADRDEGDRLFMNIVDDLDVGEVAHIVSMDPKEWYGANRELCESIGYREGMAIQHVAYRADDSTMMMWTYAIKQSSKQAIAQVYREDFNTVIPTDTTSDLWSRYVYRAKMPREWVEQIGLRTLERHKQITGSTIHHYSIDAFMAENVEEIRHIFDTYMPRIAVAINKKENDPELQSLARNIMNTAGESLKPEIRHKLMQIAHSSLFDDDSGRIMKVMIRYATLEKLRIKIPAYKKRIDGQATQKEAPNTTYQPIVEYSSIARIAQAGELHIRELNRLMAENIRVGIVARRSVGGCSGISITDARKGENTGLYNDIYSRADSASSIENNPEEDEYGSLEFECTAGCKNTRPRGKLISECKNAKHGCKGKVAC